MGLVRPMQHVFLFLLLVALPSCASENNPRLGYYGGDGSSQRHAVIAVFRGDKPNPSFTPQQWLEQHYPGCFVKAEFMADLPLGFRIYRIRTRDGQVIEVWFKTVCINCPVVV